MRAESVSLTDLPASFRLNRSFHLIVTRLSDLDNVGSFNPKTLADLRSLTQEMQVEINHHLLETMTTVEHKDWHSFEKARIRRNKARRKLSGVRFRARYALADRSSNWRLAVSESNHDSPTNLQ